MLTDDGKYNYNAYLLADNNGLSMKVAKYSGIDKVDLVENAEFGYCSIVKATDNILNKLDIENITRTKITSKQRIERRLVDSVALREAVINAIVHNDYSNEIPPVVEIFSNRIVITSSGTLPQSLTKEEFFNGISAPRNKELMRIFKDLKMVEHLGSGLQRILKMYDRSIFEILTNFIRVTFQFDEELNSRNNCTDSCTDSCTDKEKMIMELIKNDNKISTTKISEETGYSVRTVKNYIAKLKEKGYLKRIGSEKSGHWEIKL